jgi:hypothetical protein
MISEKEVIEHKMFVLGIFSTSFVRNISRSNEI